MSVFISNLNEYAAQAVGAILLMYTTSLAVTTFITDLSGGEKKNLLIHDVSYFHSDAEHTQPSSNNAVFYVEFIIELVCETLVVFFKAV